MGADIPAPPGLAFVDRKTDGAYPVTTESGAATAWIRPVAWPGVGFDAVTADGSPLCSGRRRGVFSSSWDITDRAGAAIASLRARGSGRRGTVSLSEGRTLQLDSKVLGRDWWITDATGTLAVSAEPIAGGALFRPDSWLVRAWDPGLALAQLVGLVQAHRAVLKAGRRRD